MSKKIQIAGAVLAGGKSSRFGSDKSRLIIRGKPIVASLLDRLAAAGCRPLMIAGRVPPSGSNCVIPRSVVCIDDAIPNCGPMGGLQAAFSATDADAVFLLACDMPLISVALLRRICRAFQDGDAVVPVHNGKLEPLCAIYPRRILPMVECCIAARRLAMHDLVRAIQARLLDLSALANVEREFYNINTPQDYQRIGKKR